jgi:hypothetical protein
MQSWSRFQSAVVKVNGLGTRILRVFADFVATRSCSLARRQTTIVRLLARPVSHLGAVARTETPDTFAHSSASPTLTRRHAARVRRLGALRPRGSFPDCHVGIFLCQQDELRHRIEEDRQGVRPVSLHPAP